MSLEAFQHAVLEALRVSGSDVLAETVMRTIDLYADPDGTVLLSSTWFHNGLAFRQGVDEVRVPIRYAGGGGVSRIVRTDEARDGRSVYHAELMNAGTRAPAPLGSEVARALHAWAIRKVWGEHRGKEIETEVRI